LPETNTPAYYKNLLITAVKRFIVEAHDLNKKYYHAGEASWSEMTSPNKL
jgi:hypothetical protein